MSILVNTGPTTLSWQFYDSDGVADPGTTTIGIVDGNGTEVVTAGTATTGTGTNPRLYNLAAQSDLSVLYATWTYGGGSQTDRLDIIGGWLFTETQARTFDNAVLASEGTYPDADINDQRERINQDLERWTGRAWVPKYCRIEVGGDGTRELWLDRGVARLFNGEPIHAPGRSFDTIEVLSCTVNGTSVSTSDITVFDGVLWRNDTVWTQATATDPLNIVVEFTYGVPPGTGGSDRIGMILLRDRLVPSNISDRASSFSDELGTYRFVTAGFGSNVTSIPEVNAWVRANDRRVLIA